MLPTKETNIKSWKCKKISLPYFKKYWARAKKSFPVGSIYKYKLPYEEAAWFTCIVLKYSIAIHISQFNNDSKKIDLFVKEFFNIEELDKFIKENKENFELNCWYAHRHKFIIDNNYENKYNFLTVKQLIGLGYSKQCIRLFNEKEKLYVNVPAKKMTQKTLNAMFGSKPVWGAIIMKCFTRLFPRKLNKTK